MKCHLTIVVNMNGMFQYTGYLTTLRLDNWAVPIATDKTNMFADTNPNIQVYVKDNAMKTWINTSASFPTTGVITALH